MRWSCAPEKVPLLLVMLGKHWTFVDGAGLDDEKVKVIIPNPPKELKLPAKAEPVIEKN